LILTGCPTFHINIDELNKNEGADSCLKKLKTFVVDKKYIVVALSKLSENELNLDQSDVDDDMLTLPNYGYTILDVKNKYKENFIVLRKIWYDQKKEEKCKEYEKILVQNNPILGGELYEGLLILSNTNCFKIINI